MFLAEIYRHSFEAASKAYAKRNVVLPRDQKFFDREVLPAVKKLEAHINQDPDIKAVFRIQSNIATHRMWHTDSYFNWRFQVSFMHKRSRLSLGTAVLLLNQNSPQIAQFHAVADIKTISTKHVGGMDRIARALIAEAAQRQSARYAKPRTPRKKVATTGPKL